MEVCGTSTKPPQLVSYWLNEIDIPLNLLLCYVDMFFAAWYLFQIFVYFWPRLWWAAFTPHLKDLNLPKMLLSTTLFFKYHNGSSLQGNCPAQASWAYIPNPQSLASPHSRYPFRRHNRRPLCSSFKRSLNSHRARHHRVPRRNIPHRQHPLRKTHRWSCHHRILQACSHSAASL